MPGSLLQLPLLITVTATAVATLASQPAAATTGDQAHVANLSSTPQQPQPGAGYIVILKHNPVVAYNGNIKGLSGTAVESGPPLDTRSAAVQAYVQYLTAQSAAVAARAGVTSRLQYFYHYTIAGFSTSILTDEEIRTLQADPAVLQVHRQRLTGIDALSSSKPQAGTLFTREDSSNTSGSTYDTYDKWQLPVVSVQSSLSHSRRPNVSTVSSAYAARSSASTLDFIDSTNITQSNARSHGGSSVPSSTDVVIGVIDTGIWPESESFANKAPEQSLGPLSSSSRFAGRCNTGDSFQTAQCGSKIVGCSWFNKGWGGDQQVIKLFPDAYLSCRDENGHGTHVAGLAAGYEVQLPDGRQIAGAAPKARLAVYKAFWGPSAKNTEADTLAAIEQAVADQVDVINYSAGPSYPSTTLNNAISMTFMGGARAGVFVVLSAGNEGPGPATVTHADPWATVVAAATYGDERGEQESFQMSQSSSVVNSQGVADGRSTTLEMRLPGAATNISDDWVLAEDAAVGLYPTGMLDDDKVLGRTMACDHGRNAAAGVVKAAADKQARGIGTALTSAHSAGCTVSTDRCPVATIRLEPAAWNLVRSGSYATRPRGTGTVNARNGQYTTLPRVASFSSRGPALVAGHALLKPDIAALGVDTYAATSPHAAPYEQYTEMSGTSMAAPHIAGLAAILRHRHPSWSPMTIKSAIMTTAYQIRSSEYSSTTAAATAAHSFTTTAGITKAAAAAALADSFAVGAGHADPLAMLNPGLVFDSHYQQWSDFLCGVGEHPLKTDACAHCVDDPDSCDPKNFNIPSITLLNVLASTSTTVTRTVTSVLTKQANFSHSLDLYGDSEDFLNVSVYPEYFSLGPGEVQVLEITVQVLEGAKHQQSFFGGISWVSSEGTVTRIPLVVSCVVISVPAEVHIARNSISRRLNSLSLAVADDPTTEQHTLEYSITSGFSGLLDIYSSDMVPEFIKRGTLRTEYASFNLTIPSGIALARFQLLQADYLEDHIDWDMEVSYKTKIIQSSWTAGTSDEVVDLYKPSAGAYEFGVHLHSFAVPSTPIVFLLHVFLVPEANSSTSDRADHASVVSEATLSKIDDSLQEANSSSIMTVSLSNTSGSHKVMTVSIAEQAAVQLQLSVLSAYDDVLRSARAYLGLISNRQGLSDLGRTVVSVS